MTKPNPISTLNDGIVNWPAGTSKEAVTGPVRSNDTVAGRLSADAPVAPKNTRLKTTNKPLVIQFIVGAPVMGMSN